MGADPEFLEYAKELFAGLGPIRVGRMFGGAGFYIEDAMFAVVFGDTIYMKSDAALADSYLQAGSKPFEYDTNTGTRIINGLMSLPESALDDPDEALSWARKSLVPAREAAAKKQARKSRA